MKIKFAITIAINIFLLSCGPISNPINDPATSSPNTKTLFWLEPKNSDIKHIYNKQGEFVSSKYTETGGGKLGIECSNLDFIKSNSLLFYIKNGENFLIMKHSTNGSMTRTLLILMN